LGRSFSWRPGRYAGGPQTCEPTSHDRVPPPRPPPAFPGPAPVITSVDPGPWKEALEAGLGAGRIEEGVALAPLTTFRIGGPADLLYRARTADELAEAVTVAREARVPTFILGRGANILVADAGFRGLVVKCEVEGLELLEATGSGRGPECRSFPT